MIVKMFSDYLAYTFEANDSMFMLGMRFVNKSQEDIISAVDVIHNDSIRLLYGIDGYKPLAEVTGTIANSELAIALMKFIQSIRKIEDNDFLKISAIDINFNRLFYDVKTKSIKYVLLPINYECDLHDGESWSASFRKTILILLNKIFATMPEKYYETYYAVLDDTKTDYDVLDYLSRYEFGLFNEENTQLKQDETQDGKTSLVLEHKGIDGNYVFMINKPEYVLGKSAKADGTIVCSTSVSRNHCRIIKKGNRFMVEDINSTNGTKINGYSLNPHEAYYINNGDILTVADVEFTAIIG